MKNIKIFIVGLVLVLLSACSSLITGDPTVDPKTGETTYEQSAMVTLAEAVGGILGVGTMAAAAARIAQNAARARDGIMDANKEAIDNADWSSIDSAESFKILLATAQASQDDSKLIKKQYDTWKSKRKKAEKKKETLSDKVKKLSA